MTRDFIQALLALATVMGAWFGAAALHLEWAFWVLVAGALCWAAFKWAMPRARKILVHYRELVRQGRGHERLLRVAGEHQARTEQLRLENEVLQSQLLERYGSGILEGRRRAIGELLASRTDAQLTPVAIQYEAGELMLAAQAVHESLPLVGSRWLLVVKGMNSVKAVSDLLK